MNYIDKIKELSNDNKYTKWYINLIEKSSTIKPRDEYSEGHHIVPRCILPKAAKDLNNIVYMSPRQHFIAHLFLLRMVKSKKHKFQMLEAVSIFKHNSNRTISFNSRELAWMRTANAKASSMRNKGNQYWLRRMPASDELKELRSNIAKQSKWVNNGIEQHFTPNYEHYLDIGFTFGRLPLSQEHRENIGKSLKGKSSPQPKSYSKYLSERMKNLPKEEKNRRAERMATFKKTCEHCGKTTTTANYSRWHGDKCKFRELN
jgi:hypothetical protein